MQSTTQKASHPRWLSSRNFALLLGLALIAGVATVPLWRADVAAQVGGAHDAASLRQAQGLSQAFRAAAEAALPTVVQIESHARPQVLRGPGGQPFGDGENPFKGTPFEEYFKNFEGRQFGNRTPARQGMGSGVIIDRAGVILTNNHVVEGADEIIVRLHDGHEYKATKVRTDKQTDLALVWIEAAGNLPAARLGDSDQTRTGDWVLAIGHPFHLESTVSAGIISGTGRAIRSVERSNFLQTDAAINPGNSGGPLVNLAGEVVGINTAIYSGTGVYSGIGFAVPVNTAKWVAGELLKNETVRRAYLGVGISEIGPELAEQIGVRAGQGVLVSEVRAGTPAEKAGLKDGDVIQSFAGHKVSTPRQLQIVVERSPLGKRQPMRILRDGKPLTLDVQLETLPDKLTVSTRPDDEPRDVAQPLSFFSEELGLEVSDMPPQVAERFGYQGFAGVLISQIDRDSLAFRKGLRKGMLILKVGNTRVSTAEEFEAAVQGKTLDDGVLLQIRTPRGNSFLVLKNL